MIGPQYGSPIGGTLGVLADPGTARRKIGGLTLDWSTVAAVSGAAVTTPDGIVVPIGQKYLPVGTVLVRITASNKFGPAATSAGGATAATDGRQTIDNTRIGDVYVLNENVLEAESGDVIGNVIDAGVCYKARMKCAGNGQPTFAQLAAACPGISYAQVAG